MRGMWRALAALTLGLGLLDTCVADTLTAFSFGERYDKSDATGSRIVSEDFGHGGDAVVHKRFIRLTPDRQSKRGFVWSNNRLDREKMTAVLTFRIHGQGRRWFGDGLGIWVTHDEHFKMGDNHGFTDKFYGFGIVMDTFHNTDQPGGHKDVTIQVNDGTKSLDDLHGQVKLGCDAVMRYHAKSATFDPVYSMSRVRFTIDRRNLVVEVDPQAKGEWQNCYAGDLPFTEDWLRQATVGITASTGALADNHDIVSFKAFDSKEDLGVFESDAQMQNHQFTKDYDKMIENNQCDNGCKIHILSKYIDNFEKEVEHWFEDLKESTENTINKLNAQQDENQEKIAALRLTKLVDGKIGEKMQGAKARVQEKILSDVEGKITKLSSGWVWPFFFFVLALGGVVGVAYKNYRKLVKTHMM